MITIKNLSKRFGDTVACNIPEFSIENGTVLGLVGNNGAGKTTLFRLMLDLVKADEGRIEFTDTDGTAINVATNENWKHFTGSYIDDGFLIDFLTPEEYFSFLGKISGMSDKAANERIASFTHFAGEGIFGTQKLIRNLSAGNKQKVGIISALFNRPQVVILDEPFNFLDPSSQNLLKRMLTDYSQESGATILISSHNLSHTFDISTKIALLEHGEIIRCIDKSDSLACNELKEYFDAQV